MATREDLEARIATILSQQRDVSALVAKMREEPEEEGEEPLAVAQKQLSLAYAMETLIYLYLRMSGTARADHPVHKDLERVRSYLDKVKQARGELSKRARTRVNAAAASRFVKNALWEVPSGDTVLPGRSDAGGALAPADHLIE